jgi:signal transduction histidine kinase
VDSLLDITKIELGHVQMNKKFTDLKKLLRDEITAFKVQAESKEIRLEQDIDEALPQIFCDPDQIKEVLDNLLSNAVKYTPRKGKIVIRARRLGQTAQIDIHDTGIGIKKEAQQRIFEPFQHIKKTGLEGEKSTGLGLALVKTIMEAHRGQILLKSREGQGSTFSIRLAVRSS